jgi:hypothetical protein
MFPCYPPPPPPSDKIRTELNATHNVALHVMALVANLTTSHRKRGTSESSDDVTPTSPRRHTHQALSVELCTGRPSESVGEMAPGFADTLVPEYVFSLVIIGFESTNPPAWIEQHAACHVDPACSQHTPEHAQTW